MAKYIQIARREGESDEQVEALIAGLEDDMVRAFVKVMGILGRLPSDRAKRRVLNFVTDHFAERQERGDEITGSSQT